MANATLKMLIMGEDKGAANALHNVGNAANETHGHLSNLKSVMLGVFGGAALIEGARKAVDFLKESVNAAVEDQRAEAMLDQTLHNVTGATNEQTEAVKKRLLADGEHLGIMQDQMMPAYQKLLQVTHSIKGATADLTLTENIAAAKHISLSDAAGLVAKMTMGSNRAFKEFGITVISNSSALVAVTKAQEKLAYTQQQVSSGALTGKKAIAALATAHSALTLAEYKAKDAQASVAAGMKKVADFTKGDATKAADTYSGRLAQMHVRFHDLQVKVGNGVLPILTSLSGWMLTTAVPALSAMGTWVSKNTSWLLPLTAAILGVIAAVKIWAFWQALLDTELDANPIGAVVLAIGAFVAAVILAYNKVGWFRAFIDTSFKVISAIVKTTVDFIKNHWQLMLAVLTGGVSTAVIFIVQHWNQIASVFRAVGSTIKNAWNDVIGFFGSTVHAVGAVFTSIGNAIKGAFSAAFGWVKSTFNSIIDAIQSAINTIKNNLPSLSNPLGGLNPFGGNPFKGQVHNAWVAAGSHGADPSLKMALGGIVMPRAGGTIARLAEAGQAEAVIPLNRLGSMLGGNSGPSMVNNFYMGTLPGNEQATAREIKRILAQQARISGNPAAVAVFSGAW